MTQNWVYGSQAFVDHTTGGTNVGVIARPTGTVDGDLLISICSYSYGGTLTLPTGFTHVTGSPVTDGATSKYAFAWKIASGEPSTWTFSTQGGSTFYLGLVLRYTGILAVPSPVSGVATSTTATVTAPSVTTTAADDLVVRAALTQNATSLTFASGTSRALVGANGDLIRVVDQDQVAAGATGTDVATANAGNYMAAYTVGFKQTTTSGTHVVSGQGSFAVGTIAGLAVSYAGIPSYLNTAKGNPVRYFSLGNISWATANGPVRNFYLEHSPELLVAPFAGVTLVYYSIAPGITATFQELAAL